MRKFLLLVLAVVSICSVYSQSLTPFKFKAGVHYKVLRIFFCDTNGDVIGGFSMDDADMYLTHQINGDTYMFMAYYAAGNKRVSDVLFQHVGVSMLSQIRVLDRQFTHYPINYTLIGNPIGDVDGCVRAYVDGNEAAVYEIIWTDGGPQKTNIYTISTTEYRDIISFPIEMENADDSIQQSQSDANVAAEDSTREYSTGILRAVYYRTRLAKMRCELENNPKKRQYYQELLEGAQEHMDSIKSVNNAKNAQLRQAEQDSVLGALEYRESMREQDSLYYKEKLERIKRELDSITVITTERVKNEIPIFGL